MTQGDERWNSLSDEEFYADLAARHGRGVAKVASTVTRRRREQVPLKVGVKRKPRKALPTRRVDEFDRRAAIAAARDAKEGVVTPPSPSPSTVQLAADLLGVDVAGLTAFVFADAPRPVENDDPTKGAGQ